MLYEFLRPLITLSLKNYYAHIFINNAFDYPKDKPILFAANHPNAIMEGVAHCCLHDDKQLYLVARGDVFLKPKLNKLLRRIYLLPIFRLQDGRQLMHRNEQTFDECVEIFGNNGRVMIFPEALCLYEKRLRKLRNGTAKMAIQAFKNGIDLHIVCVGVNYTSAKDYRNELMLDYAPTMRVADYKNLIETNENQAITAITNDMQQALAQRVVHIKNDEDVVLTEQLLVMARNDFAPQRYTHRLHDHPRLHTECRIAALISHPDFDKKNIAQATQNYHNALQQYHLTDAAVAPAQAINTSTKMLHYAASVPMCVGYVANMLPFKVAEYFTKKTKVMDNLEFYASVNWALGFACYVAYFLLIITLTLATSGIIWAIMLGITLPVLGHLAQIWVETIAIIKQKNRFEKLNSELRTKLQQQRKNIIQLLTLQP
jgi:1-acyl-sn-glycerol-3-phosphate acyltransferase/uncharacterized membrane protein (DUF485 family)